MSRKIQTYLNSYIALLTKKIKNTAHKITKTIKSQHCTQKIKNTSPVECGMRYASTNHKITKTTKSQKNTAHKKKSRTQDRSVKYDMLPLFDGFHRLSRVVAENIELSSESIRILDGTATLQLLGSSI